MVPNNIQLTSATLISELNLTSNDGRDDSARKYKLTDGVATIVSNDHIRLVSAENNAERSMHTCFILSTVARGWATTSSRSLHIR